MFIVVKKNDVFKAVIVAIITVFLVAMTAVGGVAPVYLAAEKRLVPVYSVETDEKVVALTFDAAWGADKTRGIIDLLKKYDADGTFFLVGFWIDKYPEETKLIAESGLEIGNHSNNHLHMSKISKDEISKEIDSVNERIKNLTGKTPAYFRPPFGEYDNKLSERKKHGGRAVEHRQPRLERAFGRTDCGAGNSETEKRRDNTFPQQQRPRSGRAENNTAAAESGRIQGGVD